MRVPLQISFHGITPSDAITAEVERRAAKLDRFYGRLTSCRVTIEAPHRHQRKGNVFRVRVDLTVPGAEIVSDHIPPDDTFANIHVAIRNAFGAALRQMQEYVRRHRGEVKAHEGPPHGFVARTFPQQGYGFLRTPDGREIYFDERSVLDGGFKELDVGTEVRYSEEQGEDGPQASTVEPIGREGRHSVQRQVS